MTAHDTIFALSTPLARSGVAVIRLSGHGALPALQQLSGKQNFDHAHAILCNFTDNNDELIDRGLAMHFAAPKSFTGEDCAELHLHGSLATIKHMIQALSTMHGLRPADPGEFTRRAYLNGKMDLLEAEGLADLIHADTQAQKAQAIRQMTGSGSQHYSNLRDAIIKVLAHLEAYIDFPDEEIPETVLANIQNEINEARFIINKTLADNHKGEKLREGFNVVILGAPNSGKSSLVNVLSGKDAAIVSQTAGTTRDVIEVSIDLDGFPVTLIDTAGIREAADDIEEEGVRRALRKAEQADLKLILFDSTDLSNMDNNMLDMAGEGDIVLLTKSDLSPPQLPYLNINNKILAISSASGEGTETLLKEIVSAIGYSKNGTPAIITRTRHRWLLEEARAHLEEYNTSLPLELACEELRRAGVCVGKITGKIQVDELLDRIFSEFCIGK